MEKSTKSRILSAICALYKSENLDLVKSENFPLIRLLTIGKGKSTKCSVKTWPTKGKTDAWQAFSARCDADRNNKQGKAKQDFETNVARIMGTYIPMKETPLEYYSIRMEAQKLSDIH